MASPTVTRTPTSTPAVPRTGVTLPPRRAAAALRRHRGRRLWRTLAWAVVGLIAAAAAGRILLRPFGTAESAHAATSRQLRLLLETGERVEREAYTFQRHWWDLYNETRGTLAVTDRRLIFVGLPPRDLLLREEGPPAFDVRAFPYDTMTFMRPGRVSLWSENGARVRTRQGREVFATLPEEMPDLRAISTVIDRYRTGAIQAAFRDRWLATLPPPPPPAPLVHVVRSGQALASIANTYGTNPDVLRRMNSITGDQIKIGQRLFVPRPDTIAVDFTADVQVAGVDTRSTNPSEPTSKSSSAAAATTSERAPAPTLLRPGQSAPARPRAPATPASPPASPPATRPPTRARP
ncbi:MAG: LysM peptidoglycan-binding domain-containing protein [Gemmatimonadaceae bacterium]